MITMVARIIDLCMLEAIIRASTSLSAKVVVIYDNLRPIIDTLLACVVNWSCEAEAPFRAVDAGSPGQARLVTD